MPGAHETSRGVLIVTVGLLAVACDSYCPKGYSHVGETCYRIKDAGAHDAGEPELDAADDAREPTSDAALTDQDVSAADPNMDDCPENACSGGTCMDALNGYSCDCPEGYAGSGTEQCTRIDPCPSDASPCQPDPCNPSPCAAGFTCHRTPAATASCAATCATSELGCQLGEPCSTDEECRTGGDENASCEPTDKVCVTVCPTTSIVSELNLDAAKYCREIDGDLIVNPGLATLPAGALPYLTRIRGRFNADLVGVLNTHAQSLTFTALQTIDGDLIFGYFQNVTLLSFPRLTSVGKGMSILLAPALERLSLPQLTTVGGNLWLAFMPVSQLDLGRLQTIGGTLSVNGLCNLPWSQASPAASLVASPMLGNIGCCTGQWTQHACSTAAGPGCMCN